MSFSSIGFLYRFEADAVVAGIWFAVVVFAGQDCVRYAVRECEAKISRTIPRTLDTKRDRDFF